MIVLRKRVKLDRQGVLCLTKEADYQIGASFKKSKKSIAIILKEETSAWS